MMEQFIHIDNTPKKKPKKNKGKKKNTCKYHFGLYICLSIIVKEEDL